MPRQDCVYMLRCRNGSLYTGWTNDIGARLHAHKTGKGAKYTRGFAAVRLVYLEPVASRQAGLRREAEIKRYPKARKEALAAEWQAAHTPVLCLGGVADAPEIAALYRWYVAHSNATFQTSLPTDEEYAEWVRHTLRTAPLLLARSPQGRLLGYACAHPWHEREAFRWDVETTVYCAHDAVGLGIGRVLMQPLLDILAMQGYWNAYALIADPNPASEALHAALGYACQGRTPRTGYKLGAWQGLSTWCFQLRKGTAAPDAEPDPTPARDAVLEILRRYAPVSDGDASAPDAG